MRLRDWIDKMNTSTNVFIVLMLTLIFAAIPGILSLLSFLGIKEISDTVDAIYGITNIYGSFNVDLKILVWSMINTAFTFYVYRLFKTSTEDPDKIINFNKIINLTSELDTANTKIDTANSEIINLTSELDTANTKIDNLTSLLDSLKNELQKQNNEVPEKIEQHSEVYPNLQNQIQVNKY